MTVTLSVVAVAATLIIAVAMVKTGHIFKALFTSVALGIIALFAVNVISAFTGVSIGVNAVSVFVSAVGGISGVVTLLVMNTLFSACP